MLLCQDWRLNSNTDGYNIMTRLEHSILQSHFPPNSCIVLDRATASGHPCDSVGRVLYIDPKLDRISVYFEDGKSYALTYGVDIFHRYIKPISHKR